VTVRVALFAVFACCGMTLAAWGVHLPSLQRDTGISTAMLGTVLLCFGGGALVGMQVAGYLSDRWGAGRATILGSAAMSACIPLPFVSTGIGWVIPAVVVLGVSAGTADVAMNAAGVALERAYARPIMSAFHGLFSVGATVGSGIAAVGFLLEGPTVATTAVMAAVCLALVAAASVWLRSPVLQQDEQPASTADVPESAPAPGRRLGRILVLGMLAFLLLLGEGSAMDWSSLHAQRHLGASPAQGTMAFAAFVLAITIGRLVVDRIAGRVGPVAVLRYGGLLAAAGALVVVTVPLFPVVLLGWALFAFGLAGGFPQVLSAAGNLGADSGRALGRVVGIGYLALMAGPALVGWIGEATSLNTALLVPAAAAALCVLAAGAVRRDQSAATAHLIGQ
jgi:predicted MFS family arabinose efflux permease